jgi:hypothetical protein
MTREYIEQNATQFQNILFIDAIISERMATNDARISQKNHKCHETAANRTVRAVCDRSGYS